MEDIKKFITFVKEDLDLEDDPYGEETDDVSQPEPTESKYTMEDFDIQGYPYIRTVFEYDVTINDYSLKLKLIKDDETPGYDLEIVDEENIPEHILDFIEDYKDEIEEELLDRR